MNNGVKIKATIFIVIFLLLVALIVYIIGGNGDVNLSQSSTGVGTGSGQTADYSQGYTQGQDTGYNQTQSQSAAGDAQQYSQQYVQQPAQDATIVYTQSPVYTVAPTPMPTPEPTPIPTPTPQPVGMALGSGQFKSDSGSLLNIHADWSAAVESETTASVTVIVYLDHYQLDYDAYKNLKITVGDTTQTVDSTSIHYNTAALCATPIGTATFSVPVSRGEMKSFSFETDWYFGGVYGDGKGNKVNVDTITCKGDISIAR